MRKRIDSFKYAFNGIFEVVKSEINMKIHIAVMLLVIIFGFVFQISAPEWLLCIVCFGTVITAEMLNSAIETVVDLVSPQKNELARKAKDIAAGAVLISAFCAVIMGLIIFLPKLFGLFS